MIQFAIKFVVFFIAYWLAVHLCHAFIMLDWSLFTEWDPLSRGLNLLWSIYLGFTVALPFRKRLGL